MKCRKANEILDFVSDSIVPENSSIANMSRQLQLTAQQNASKYEADLREAILNSRNQTKSLDDDRAELDRLRAEADKSGEDVRNQEEMIRLSQASLRETRARCVASFLGSRVVRLTRNLSVGRTVLIVCRWLLQAAIS